MGALKPTSLMMVGIQKVSVELAHSRQKKIAIISHTLRFVRSVRQSWPRSPMAALSRRRAPSTTRFSSSVSQRACSGLSVM
jgi:hypothetical protein